MNVTKQPGHVKYALSGDDAFIATVDPGETFTVETAININDGVITHVGQQLTPADVTLPFVNGATGPIQIRGGEAGRHADRGNSGHEVRRARVHRALARDRHVS